MGEIELKKLLGMTMLFVLLVGSLIGCSESTIEKAEPTSANAEETNAGSEEKEEAPKDETKTLAVGEGVNFDDMQVTLNSVETSEGSDWETPEEDKYLILDLTVVNNSDEEKTISSLMNFSLKDAESYSYDITIFTEIKSQLDGTIGAGDTLRGQLAFDVPNSDEYQLIFEDPFTSGQAIWVFNAE